MITYWTDALDGATWQVRVEPVAEGGSGATGRRTRVRFEGRERAFETIVDGALSVSELEHAQLAALLDQARWSGH